MIWEGKHHALMKSSILHSSSLDYQACFHPDPQMISVDWRDAESTNNSDQQTQPKEILPKSQKKKQNIKKLTIFFPLFNVSCFSTCVPSDHPQFFPPKTFRSSRVTSTLLNFEAANGRVFWGMDTLQTNMAMGGKSHIFFHRRYIQFRKCFFLSLSC